MAVFGGSAGYVITRVRRTSSPCSSVRPTVSLTQLMVCGGRTGCLVQYSTKNLAHKAASGSLAEEVLSTVRTCKAFGMGRVFGQLFEGHVEQSRRIGYRIAAAVGAVTGAMFFVIYCGVRSCLWRVPDCPSLAADQSSLLPGSTASRSFSAHA
jgi:ATP-binding cassette subfamily B (MDR/TAP) protein 1